jgi:hypothetical protein
MTNPCSAEAEETADVPDEEYKEPSIRQIFVTICDHSVHTYSNSISGVGIITHNLSLKVELINQNKAPNKH